MAAPRAARVRMRNLTNTRWLIATHRLGCSTPGARRARVRTMDLHSPSLLCAKFFLGNQPEIHLFLKRVHLRHLDGHFVAEANDAAGPTSNEMIARGVEIVEVVLHRGKRHQPAHR